MTRGRPERSLVEGASQQPGGRNAYGRITAWHRGGGHKRLYGGSTSGARSSACRRRSRAIEYDPNRSAHIALLHYRDGEKRYILAPHGLKVGDELVSGPTPRSGRATRCRSPNIPLGTVIHAIELKPGKGAQLVRSAGVRRAADGARGQLRDAADAERRDPAGPRALPGDHRTGRQPRAREPEHRQGRALALARQAPERPRRRDEPGRPSDGRWRGQLVGRSSPVHAVGQADEGLQDPQEQRDATSTS